MRYKTICLRRDNGLAILTLNRPANLNALNSLLLQELLHALVELEREEEVRVIILTGGGKCFSSGFDLGEINGFATPADARWFFRQARELFDRLETMEQPVIAAIAGLALGGGCELALACDLRIATEKASFGLPEIKNGMIPGGGGTQRLPRLIGATKAKELLYTGDYINAQEAYRLGLLNKVVPGESEAALLDGAKVVAQKIAHHPQEALKAAKLAVNSGLNMDIRSAIAYETRCVEGVLATEDHREGVLAFIEKRKPVFKNR